MDIVEIPICENCKKELQLEDWPYSFRGLLDLCNNCKIKANYLLKELSKRRLK